MNKVYLIILLMLSCSILAGQEMVVPLYEGPVPGSEEWDWEEQEMKNEAFNLWLVYNVTNPTLTVFRPEQPNGTAVINCPGGGFQFLSIDSEEYSFARSLNEKGITAFVLKYRVARSFTDNPTQEFMFILAATDDIFGFQEHCVGLYNDWDNAGKAVELHLYARGGHGFGMNRSGLPVDTWIDRFTDWLGMLGYTE